MTTNSLESPDDDLNGRRAIRTIRVVLGPALVIAAIVGLVSFIVIGNRAVTYRSTGSLELTDEIASGINVANRRGDALLEIEAQILQLESLEFRQLVDTELGERADELNSLIATSRVESSVITIVAKAQSVEVAELAVTAALEEFVDFRRERQETVLDNELSVLLLQRESQLATIDELAGELQDKRGVAPQDEISILESRTSAALRRLEQYDIAIQEREFVTQSSTGQLRIVNVATAATPVSSGALIPAAQLAAATLFVILVVSVVVARFRGRLVLLDEVRAVAGPDVPILATIPKFRARLRKGPEAIVVGRRGKRREAEAFRYLRTALDVAADGLLPLSVAFTSSNANEGKTVTSANYALAVAVAERSVALLDGDLLNPSIGAIFSSSGTSAFSGLLTEEVDAATAHWHRVATHGESLDVLVGDHAGGSARREIPADSMFGVLGKLKKNWDVVVVDCPPVLAVSDAMVLAKAADLAVLIVRLGRTTKSDLGKSLIQLEQNQVRLAGIAVTHCTDKSESYYGYGYEYGSEAQS